MIVIFFVISFKTYFASFIIFQEKALNIITIRNTHCIYINKWYENFSLVLHAEDNDDSRAISFICSSYSNLFSNLGLETFNVYFCLSPTLIELCKNLLPNLYYRSELYSQHCQTTKMEMFGKKISVSLLAVNLFLSNA